MFSVFFGSLKSWKQPVVGVSGLGMIYISRLSMVASFYVEWYYCRVLFRILERFEGCMVVLQHPRMLLVVYKDEFSWFLWLCYVVEWFSHFKQWVHFALYLSYKRAFADISIDWIYSKIIDIQTRTYYCQESKKPKHHIKKLSKQPKHAKTIFWWKMVKHSLDF